MVDTIVCICINLTALRTTLIHTHQVYTYRWYIIFQ